MSLCCVCLNACQLFQKVDVVFDLVRMLTSRFPVSWVVVWVVFYVVFVTLLTLPCTFSYHLFDLGSAYGGVWGGWWMGHLGRWAVRGDVSAGLLAVHDVRFKARCALRMATGRW